MTVFERIKEVSKKRGLSLQKVATDAHLGINAIYRWKTQTPTADSLKAVAEVLNVSVDYLLGNTDDPNRYLDARDFFKNFSDSIREGLVTSFSNNMPANIKFEKNSESIDIIDLLSENRLTFRGELLTDLDKDLIISVLGNMHSEEND